MLRLWLVVVIVMTILVFRGAFLIWGLHHGVVPMIPSYITPPPPAKPGVPPAVSPAVLAKVVYHGERMDLGSANLAIPADLHWLDAQDAAFACVQMGQLNGHTLKGMLLPADESLSGTADDPGRWGMAIATMPNHLDDSVYDNTIDKDTLLASLIAANKALQDPAIVLVGWAQPPHYDARRHTLSWAKHYRIGGRDVTTFALRLFDRNETLMLDSIGKPQDLATYQHVAQEFIGNLKLNQGADIASVERSDIENELDPPMIFADDPGNELTMSSHWWTMVIILLISATTLGLLWWNRRSLLERFGGIAQPLPPGPRPPGPLRP